MREIILVAGARPNFIKLAPVIHELQKAKDSISWSLVHTGQHYDIEMSAIFFSQLSIPVPDVSLNVGSASHGQQTARIMAAFEEYLFNKKPAETGVVVFGDVNSTAACSIAAVKLGIPVAHVEAGLRSFDRTMPEEINRLITDVISDILLVSEPEGIKNLHREGIDPDKVHYVGNVMIDTLIEQLPAARALGMTDRLSLEPGNYVFVTLHRPSNVDEFFRLQALVDFLLALAQKITVVFPLHPRTRERLNTFGLMDRLSGETFRLLDPLGYRENLGLLASCRFIITDSGGIQEEASFLGLPCLTFRDNTERPVTVTQGTNTLIGHDLDVAWKVIAAILEDAGKAGRPIEGWDGRAAERIVAILKQLW